MSTMLEAAELLRGFDKILILSHASPDGDTLGSATALMRGLQLMGKQVCFGCSDPVPAKYHSLFDGIVPQDFQPEKIVTVDVADLRLLGDLADVYGEKIDLAIDHHATHRPYAVRRWVDGHAAAAALMIYELLGALKIPIGPALANCLYTGISTDTGCFRYGNADARAYRAAADLIELGASSADINRLMFDTKTRACIEVERRVLADMEFLFDGKLASACIPRALVVKTGAAESDLDGIPARVRGIEGVLVGVTLKEKEDGQWKASVRAAGGADAAKICQTLGGGGHKGAAACSLGADLALAKERLFAACGAQLKELEAS